MEFIETPLFAKAVRGLLSDDELGLLQMNLSLYPGAGAVIPGSGGLRKLRWMAGGRGKRGGLRIIYYWITAGHQIYLLYAYRKNRQEDLTAEEIRYLRSLLEE